MWSSNCSHSLQLLWFVDQEPKSTISEHRTEATKQRIWWLKNSNHHICQFPIGWACLNQVVLSCLQIIVNSWCCLHWALVPSLECVPLLHLSVEPLSEFRLFSSLVPQWVDLHDLWIHPLVLKKRWACQMAQHPPVSRIVAWAMTPHVILRSLR